MSFTRNVASGVCRLRWSASGLQCIDAASSCAAQSLHNREEKPIAGLRASCVSACNSSVCAAAASTGGVTAAPPLPLHCQHAGCAHISVWVSLLACAMPLSNVPFAPNVNLPTRRSLVFSACSPAPHASSSSPDQRGPERSRSEWLTLFRFDYQCFFLMTARGAIGIAAALALTSRGEPAMQQDVPKRTSGQHSWRCRGCPEQQAAAATAGRLLVRTPHGFRRLHASSRLQ